MFLEQIQSQMHSLEQLIGSSLSGSDSRQFEQNAHDIQSNIQFMKELNETFTYLQLPIKLPSQTAGSELYVYTQKEKRQADPEKMRVLLHLDLEHLGKLETDSIRIIKTLPPTFVLTTNLAWSCSVKMQHF